MFTFTFKPTHKIIHQGREILVEEIPGDNEFCTREDVESFDGGPCGLGSYALDDLDNSIILERADIHDPEEGIIVNWKPAEDIVLEKLD